MKIFISYSTPDLNVVHQVALCLKPLAEVFYWDDNKVPGQVSWETIGQWIKQSDLVVALVTGNTLTRAMSVGQEIGIARENNKTIVPIVGPEVPASELGCLSGITYQRFDRYNLTPAIEVVKQIIINKVQKKERDQAILLIGGIVVLIWALSKS